MIKRIAERWLIGRLTRRRLLGEFYCRAPWPIIKGCDSSSTRPLPTGCAIPFFQTVHGRLPPWPSENIKGDATGTSTTFKTRYGIWFECQHCGNVEHISFTSRPAGFTPLRVPKSSNDSMTVLPRKQTMPFANCSSESGASNETITTLIRPLELSEPPLEKNRHT